MFDVLHILNKYRKCIEVQECHCIEIFAFIMNTIIDITMHHLCSINIYYILFIFIFFILLDTILVAILIFTHVHVSHVSFFIIDVSLINKVLTTICKKTVYFCK